MEKRNKATDFRNWLFITIILPMIAIVVAFFAFKFLLDHELGLDFFLRPDVVLISLVATATTTHDIPLLIPQYENDKLEHGMYYAVFSSGLLSFVLFIISLGAEVVERSNLLPVIFSIILIGGSIYCQTYIKNKE